MTQFALHQPPRRRIAVLEGQLAAAKRTITRLRALSGPPDLILFLIEKYKLSRVEAEIVAVIANTDGICEKRNLYAAIRKPGRRTPNDGTLHKHIQNIRAVLDPLDIKIKTHFGTGYSLSDAGKNLLKEGYIKKPKQEPRCPNDFPSFLMEELGISTPQRATVTAIVVTANGICTKARMQDELWRLMHKRIAKDTFRVFMRDLRRELLGHEIDIQSRSGIGLVAPGDVKNRLIGGYNKWTRTGRELVVPGDKPKKPGIPTHAPGGSHPHA